MNANQPLLHARSLLRSLPILGFALLCFTGTSAQSEVPRPRDISGRIVTVMGDIQPQALGATLTHEHLIIDFSVPLADKALWAETGRGHLHPTDAEQLAFWHAPVSLKNLAAIQARWEANRENLILDSTAEAVAELTLFREAGGNAIVDVTSIGLGRDPVKLREISRATGLHIVMGTSWYKDGWAPPSTAEATVEELTAFLLRELSQGAVASGIHPGIIGEVGAEDAASNPLSAAEHRRLIASTRAALLSGAPLSVHTWWDPGQAVNVPGIIEEQGLSPSRVMLSHAGAVAQDHALLRRLASAGYYLSFDTFAIPTHPLETSHDQAMLEAIVMLAREGLGERILVAQDVCTKVQMRSYGGHGYAFVLTDLVPRLRNLGLSAEQLQKILIDNPRRLLTFDPPRSPSW